MFLQILGILFLIVICIVAYFAWKIYRFAKTQENSDIAVAMSVLPSQSMELELSGKDEWKEQEQLVYSESELKRVGATHVGYYCVYNGYAIIRISMWNFKDQAVAVLYEALSELDEDKVSFIYEVASKLDDGSLCITSNPHAAYESRPDKHKIVFNESKSIIDFLKLIKVEVPEGKKILKIKDPREFFLECYEDISEMGWMPEQLKSDKTQQTLSSVGVTITEELMKELIEMGVSYSIHINVRRARRKLAKHSKMSADQWEKIRDQLVFINEKMEVDHLVDAIYDLTGELSEIQEQALEGFQINTKELTDPIGAFQMLLQSLNLKVKRVASMDSPINTEVYLPL
ncbi:MAG: hypothetical protein ACRBHB_06095 [Arenicella sp.]